MRRAVYLGICAVVGCTEVIGVPGRGDGAANDPSYEGTGVPGAPTDDSVSRGSDGTAGAGGRSSETGGGGGGPAGGPDVAGGQCEEGTERCADDTVETCTAAAWIPGELCPDGCWRGACAVVVDGGSASGELAWPGRLVILRGTIQVEPWDGAPGTGSLQVRAGALRLEGTIDADGAGHPGSGGGGGGGGGCRNEPHGTSAPGGSGAESGAPGGGDSACGSTKYGAPGGAGGAGAGSSGGPGGGGGGCNTPNYNNGGKPGGPGGPGGYAAAGSNGDASVDDVVWPGSGGGGGGGGSGGGNGNGEGGGGGGGGGAGGAGGGAVSLIATESLVIEGTILARGVFGGDGASATGAVKTADNEGIGGDGGSGGGALVGGDGEGGSGGGHQGGGTDGAGGGAGGGGAGGGVLLSCGAPDGLVVTGIVDARGAGAATTNGGTIKVRYAGSAPGATLLAGRVHLAPHDGGVPPCGGGCPPGLVCDAAADACVAPEGCATDGDCPDGDQCDGGACVALQPPVGPASIFDAQREAWQASGVVTVQGDRLVVGGQTWYPKTDFLTAVPPGDDISTYTTHCYLSQGAARRQTIRDALVASQYNSIYLYTLNQGDYGAGGSHPENVVTPFGSGGWSMDTAAPNQARLAEWRQAVQSLIADHRLKPFLWLAADDSPSIASSSTAAWTAYVDLMMATFDDLPVVWVLGLEVDEYWSAAGVGARRKIVMDRTTNPVGVHLTIGESANPASPYRDGFDFVMLQYGSPADDASYVAGVKASITGQQPAIAAEFNVKGTGTGGEAEGTVTERSKAIGAVIASVGEPPLVAGIGNGISLGQTPACTAVPESCNGADDDCDGQVDEGGVCDAPPVTPPALPSDFAGVKWLHTDVSAWKQTATLKSVSVSGGEVCLDYDKANVWPGVDHVGAFVNANPWIFVWQGGVWYAATWEWMKHGQTCKSKSAVAGDHIKQDPLATFQPASGATYWFMVSGLARDAVSNVKERSNPVKVIWP